MTREEEPTIMRYELMDEDEEEEDEEPQPKWIARQAGDVRALRVASELRAGCMSPWLLNYADPEAFVVAYKKAFRDAKAIADSTVAPYHVMPRWITRPPPFEAVGSTLQ